MPGIEDQAAAALHILGLILTMVAGARMRVLARRAGVNLAKRRAVLVFIASWLVLYAASVAFHLAPSGTARQLLMAFDQGAIFILIAAAWAPLAPFRMAPDKARQLLATLWSLAGLGILIELVAGFSAHHRVLHQTAFALYLLQAAVPFALCGRTMLRRLTPASLGWMVGSMIVYSVGLYFYKRTGMQWNHVVWHFMILVGCGCNFGGLRQLLLEDGAAKLSREAGRGRAESPFERHLAAPGVGVVGDVPRLRATKID